MQSFQQPLYLPINSRTSTRLMCIRNILGYIYFIDGYADYRFPQAGSRAVTRLCIADGSSKRMKPLSHPVVRPAVAGSYSSIVVCGGMLQNIPVSTCQLLSLPDERLVRHIIRFKKVQFHVKSSTGYSLHSNNSTAGSITAPLA